MNQTFKKLSELAERFWIAFGIIGFFTVLLPDCRKQMSRRPHAVSTYTKEEQEVIDRYLEDQHQFDYDWGGSKGDRM